MSAYVPHDGVHEDSRLKVWENLSDRVNQISASNSLIVLGDFNAQMHAQKQGEEQYIGPHMFGRGAEFLRTKEILQADKVLNRSSLVDLLLEHELRIMNTFVSESSARESTFKLV
eukprot:12134191-Heterocapsa_arctica.AAC.1